MLGTGMAKHITMFVLCDGLGRALKENSSRSGSLAQIPKVLCCVSPAFMAKMKQFSPWQQREGSVPGEQHRVAAGGNHGQGGVTAKSSRA